MSSAAGYFKEQVDFLQTRNPIRGAAIFEKKMEFINKQNSVVIKLCLFTLESPYHLAAVSGAHFTQGTILIVII